MKFDDSLLNSPNPITLDDLKTYFRKNDFTSSVDPSEPISVRPNSERIYPKIRSCFVEAWNRSLKKLGIDLYGKQYSAIAPLNILKQADSKIVTEAVLNIIEDEEYMELCLNAFCTMMEEPLTQAMEAYAESTGKAPDELSDEELSPLVDRMADELLDKMMNLLQQTQEVPAVAQSEKASRRRKTTRMKTAQTKSISTANGITRARPSGQCCRWISFISRENRITWRQIRMMLRFQRNMILKANRPPMKTTKKRKDFSISPKHFWKRSAKPTGRFFS